MDNTKPSGPLDGVSDESNNTSVDGIEPPKSVDYSKYQKLLGEKKKEQSEKEALKVRLDEIENEKLQSQGKLKEYSDNLVKQLAEEKKKNQSTHKLYSETILKKQFLAEAAKRGCVDPEAAYKLSNLSGIEIKDDFSFDGDGLDQSLAELQTNKSWLFKKEVSAPKDLSPKSQNNSDAFVLKNAKADDLLAILKAKQTK